MPREKLFWKKKPEKRDYVAAESFLSLVFREPQTRSLVRALRAAPVKHRSAKDLLRASGLPLLPKDESSVRGDLKKIGKGKALSPVLVVCGDISKGVPLTIADGYHRICAACHFDEFAPVACQMVQH